jgi:methionyl-tRNA formyltransferase
MRFDEVILVGSGKIACDCVKYLVSILPVSQIYVLESADVALSMLERICRSREVVYEKQQGKALGECLLHRVSGQRVLIISANNRYIFRKELINSRWVEIINFHYALLPHYRGMNIPTWVIYNREKVTGITWHYVTEKVDCGRIISQREIVIDNSATAFDIVRQGMLCGIESFQTFIGELLEHEISGEDVEYPAEEEIYYSSRLPADGILNTEASVEDMIVLLRSYDYRGTQVIPPLRVKHSGIWYYVDKYSCEGVSSTPDRRIWTDDTFLVTQNSRRLTISVKPL